MPLPDAATSYYKAQQRTSLSTLALARRLWAKLGAGDFDEAWRTLGPQLLVVLMAGQRAAVAQAVAYVPAVLDELNVSAVPVAEVAAGSLVGIASDGRPLASLLYQTVVKTRTALGQGLSLSESLSSGGDLLDEIVSTQVVDAGRDAESLGAVVRPDVTGFVRMLVLPSCDRCAILAGRFYKWNAGFLRHPHCDCRHIPATEMVAGDMTVHAENAVKAGQVTGLSKADRQAILDGADAAKVVNAKRGMTKAQGVKLTTEGTTRRGGYSKDARAADATLQETSSGKGRRKQNRVPPRLRPESIYELAGDDREQALTLLKKYGYIV